MRLVVLIRKCLERFADQHVHVFSHWVGRLLIFLKRYKLIGLLNTQHLKHLAMEERHVVDLWSRGSKLNDGLVLHNTLAQCCSVGVTNRQNVHIAVVRLFG